MAFQIALSGLAAAQTDLEVTGHNIANASTIGFKAGRAEFADLYASSISDTSARSAGRGVQVTRVAQQFSQGSIENIAMNIDLDAAAPVGAVSPVFYGWDIDSGGGRESCLCEQGSICQGSKCQPIDSYRGQVEFEVFQG